MSTIGIPNITSLTRLISQYAPPKANAFWLRVMESQQPEDWY